MPEDIQYHSAYDIDDVIDWVQSQVKAAQKPGASTPSWMIKVFEDVILEGPSPRDQASLAIRQRVSREAHGSKDDDTSNFKLVYFKVENTIFKVVKDWLVVDGSAFVSMLNTPGQAVEGMRRRNPIVLEHTSASAFKALLCVLSSMSTLKAPSISRYSDWIAALELAIRWKFDQARKQAIKELNVFLVPLGPAAHISLGRRFSIGPWLRKGLTDIITAITQGQYSRAQLFEHPQFPLDMETIAKISFACFELSTSSQKGTMHGAQCNRQKRRVGLRETCFSDCRTVSPIHGIVDSMFGDEIKACRYGDKL